MTRKMKDSGIEWIGEIPEDWKLTKVKHIGKYINGYPFKPSDWSDSGVPIIRIQNLTGNNSEYNYYSGPKLPEDYFIIKNDYLISWSATLGVFIWHKDNGYLNQHIFKAVPNKAVINYNYFYWIAKIFIEEIQSYMHGSAMQHVTKAVFDNFTIPLPSVKQEQKKISTFLDKKTKKIEDIKNTISKEIENLENYKKSMITEAVTKGLDKNVEMKDSGIDYINEYPAHWEIKRVKYLISERNARTKDGKGELLSVSQYRGVIPSSTNKMRVAQAKSLIGYKLVKKSDLVFNKLNPELARFGVSEYDGITSPDYAVYIVSRESILEKFLELILRTDRYAVEYGRVSLGVGEGFKRLYTDQLGRFNVACPLINEQNQIVEYLDKKTKLIDDSIAIKQKQLETLEEYKKFLIYEYVTGKKEVEDGEET